MAWARGRPSITRVRTAARVALTRGDSLWRATVPRTSSMGMPALARVAICRVASDSSSGLIRRWNMGMRSSEGFSATSVTAMGIRPFSRRRLRTCREESPSSTPLRVRPVWSRATYSKAGISVLPGHAQDLFQRGVPGQHAAQTVLADADLTEAGMAHHGLLAGTVMDQTAQGVVDLDQLIDAGTPAVTAAIAFRATHRAVQGRCLCRVHFQQLAFPDGGGMRT